MENLYDYQTEAANTLASVLKDRYAAVDGSDTGVGKTYTACGVTKILDLPTLAVVPKISITPWQRAADRVGVELDIINWEKVRTGNYLYGRMEWLEDSKGVPFQGFKWHPGVKFLIFDEIQRGNGFGTLNSQMVIAARRQNIFTLGLSATPAATPLDFRVLGYLLGMHTLNGPASFYAWSKGLGCGPAWGNKGWEWLVYNKEKQRKIMAQLSAQVFPKRGVRIRHCDVPGFQERTIKADLYDIGDPQKVNALYAEMEESLKKLAQREALDPKPRDRKKAAMLVSLRARQKIELLKVPGLVEMTKDYLGQGYSVALFVNFSETIRQLRLKLKCDCYIDGSQTGSPAERQNHIDRFQANHERVIIVNSQAGGVACDLHDILGDFPVVGIVVPHPSAMTMKQVFGRIHRQGAKSPALYRVVFAAGTSEEESRTKLAGKLDNIDALMDCDLVPNNLEDLI